MTEALKWKLTDISTHPDLQIRVKTDPETVDRYAALYSDGQYLPPVSIIESTDGNIYLIDGHHRYAAAQKAGLDEISAVLEGENATIDKMVLAAIQANSRNGLALTSKDRQRAAELLIINRPELSLRKIAQEVGISKSTVENYIRKLIEKRQLIKCEFCAEYTAYKDYEAREWHPHGNNHFICPKCYPNRELLALQRSIAFHAQNLHECTKCGTAPDVAILEGPEGLEVRVECPQCGSKSPSRKMAYGAIQIWNYLHPVPISPQTEEETPKVETPAETPTAPEAKSIPVIQPETIIPNETSETLQETLSAEDETEPKVKTQEVETPAETTTPNESAETIQETLSAEDEPEPKVETQEDPKLTKCPFCGSKATFIEKNYGEAEYSVSCDNPDCSCYPETDNYATKTEAAEVWNRRFISSRSAKEIVQRELEKGISLFSGKIRLQLKTAAGETFLEVEQMNAIGISSVHSYPSPNHQ